jgi:flagellar motility protein MotE (MotC chaperone)
MNGYDNFFKKAREARRRQPADSHTQEIPLSRSNSQRPKAQRPMQLKRRRAGFPMLPVVILAGISALLGWWSVDPALPERLLTLVDVRMMGAATAAEDKSKEKSAATKAESRAGNSAPAAKANDNEEKSAAPVVTEDASHLEKLRERKESLDHRERELNELEEELHKQKAEIESRIKQLEELRTQIAAVLKERVEVDQEKVMKLVETYSNMKPKQAAEILGGIDEDLAVEVLGKMKKKNAAEILNLLEPGKARSISEKYAGYRRR